MAPPLRQFLKRALARRLHEWAAGVLEDAEGAAASSAGVPGPSVPAEPGPGPRDESAAAAAADADINVGGGPPAVWLDYIRERAPHLVVGGRFRPLRGGDLGAPLPRPLASPAPRRAAPQADSAPGRERGAPPPAIAEAPRDLGPTPAPHAAVPARAETRAMPARAETRPPAPARTDAADPGVWPRRRRVPVAADTTTDAGNDRGLAAPDIAATPAVVDAVRSFVARGRERPVPAPDVPPPSDRTTARPAARAAAPDVPVAVPSPPRLRSAGEPVAPVVERRARRAEHVPAPAAPESAREESAIATRSRPVWSPEPPAERALERAPVARPAARFARPRDVAQPAWAAPANGGVAPAIAARPAPAPPPASAATNERARRESTVEARDLWPALPPLALTVADDVGGDLEARERRERLRREQVGAP